MRITETSYSLSEFVNNAEIKKYLHPVDESSYYLKTKQKKEQPWGGGGEYLCYFGGNV